MPLQTAVQIRSGQAGDTRLQRIQAVVQRQERVAPERHNGGFFLRGQHRRCWLLRPHGRVMNKIPSTPLRRRLLIDAVAGRQRLQALLTILYCSTHDLCRTGASVQYLSHESSLRSWPYITPAHRGTKQVGTE